MTEKNELPNWVKGREEFLEGEENVDWRYGKKPDYRRINENQEKERKHRHAEGSLNAIAHNLVKAFEMEATFKTNPEQWKSVVVDKFRMSVNGGKQMDAQDVINEGTYNLFLGDSDHYQSSKETFESSYKLFHNAFPKGFFWELIEVLSPPPAVVFKWRHWGTFSKAYNGHEASGKTVEIVGISTAKLSEDLKIETVEHYFDSGSFLSKLTAGKKVGTAPQEEVTA